MCDECGESFTSKSGLRDHKKRHVNEYRHACRVCGKGYMTMTLLRSHELQHVGVSVVYSATSEFFRHYVHIYHFI